jgi:hypothetical protein
MNSIIDQQQQAQQLIEVTNPVEMQLLNVWKDMLFNFTLPLQKENFLIEKLKYQYLEK